MNAAAHINPNLNPAPKCLRNWKPCKPWAKRAYTETWTRPQQAGCSTSMSWPHRSVTVTGVLIAPRCAVFTTRAACRGIYEHAGGMNNLGFKVRERCGQARTETIRQEFGIRRLTPHQRHLSARPYHLACFSKRRSPPRRWLQNAQNITVLGITSPNNSPKHAHCLRETVKCCCRQQVVHILASSPHPSHGGVPLWAFWRNKTSPVPLPKYATRPVLHIFYSIGTQQKPPRLALLWNLLIRRTWGGLTITIRLPEP